jgi:hypothetical protein
MHTMHIGHDDERKECDGACWNRHRQQDADC